MIFISHRGNLSGKNTDQENSPFYIEKALSQGFDVEVDVWFLNGNFYLGHDKPQYEIDYGFLINEKIWCHAKNIESLFEMKKYVIHYFWHENDTVTLTSKNYVWAYPTKDFPNNTIAVLPEILNSEIKKCKGVCSDFIKEYKEKYG
jgi:hypothetical protein